MVLYVAALMLMSSPLFASQGQTAATSGFLLSKSTFSANDNINLTFWGGSGSSSDWFGIYPLGVQPGQKSATDWKYINNSRVASATGITGKITFAAQSLPAGRYSVWFLANNGYSPLAQAANIEVLGAAAQAALSLQDAELDLQQPLQVDFTNPDATATDWLGVYAKGVQPGPGSAAWWYLNGTKTAGTAVGSGSLQMALALGAGQYDLWLLAKDGYNAKAGPVTFSIKNNQPLTWFNPQFRIYPAVSGQHYQLKLAAYLKKNSATFSMKLLSAPGWLTLSPDGILSGLPSHADVGQQQLVVRALDNEQQTFVDATITLPVLTALQYEQKAVRIMTYNVWRAFGQVEQGYQKGLTSILTAQADIIALQEANVALAAKLAGDLGWYHAVGAYPGIQTISRFPVVDSTNIDFSLLAKIKLPYQNNLFIWLANTHLDPHYYGPYAAELAGASAQSVLQEENRSSRLPQIRFLLQGLQPLLAGAKETPVLLLGDFNVPSHLDWTAATAAKRNGVGQVIWPTSDAVHKAGFSDSYRVIHPDPVLQPGNTWSPVFKGTEPQDRIDRIYWQGAALKPTAASTFTTTVQTTLGREGSAIAAVAKNSWPSDHAAVFSDMAPRYHPADMDKNGLIDSRDISLFRQQLSLGALAQVYDFNNDGLVSPLDVRAMMALCHKPQCASQ